jgi:hypothetical protein
MSLYGYSFYVAQACRKMGLTNPEIITCRSAIHLVFKDLIIIVPNSSFEKLRLHRAGELYFFDSINNLVAGVTNESAI